MAVGFLQKLLCYDRILIQCHNNPDADTLASAFGVYRYLQSKGKQARIVYGGEETIKKFSTKLMLGGCDIPAEHVRSLPEHDALLMVDCQRGNSNAEIFPTPECLIIDHHIRIVPEGNNYFINSDYQACATIIYELLLEEGYPVKEDRLLSVALLYALYTDTSCFDDLFSPADTAMRQALYDKQPLFERLAKSCMSVAELMIVSDAMLHHYLDVERRFAIVEAQKCEQTVLGTIGDFMIKVDAVNLNLAYTQAGDGYQISIRTSHEAYRADRIAAYICEGIGGGGGHAKKGGGRIIKSKMQEKHGSKSAFEVINMLMCSYCDSLNITV